MSDRLDNLDSQFDDDGVSQSDSYELSRAQLDVDSGTQGLEDAISTDQSSHLDSSSSNQSSYASSSTSVKSSSTQQSNVPVCIRIRPQSAKEQQDGPATVIATGRGGVSLHPPASFASAPSSLAYSDVFGPEASQADVFSTMAMPVLDRFLQGQSGQLQAYGVTCSGKTYTIFGEDKNPGILKRSLEYIFGSLTQSQDEAVQNSLAMQCVEVYGSRIIDLLAVGGSSVQPEVALLTSAKGCTTVLKNVTVKKCVSALNANSLLTTALTKRITKATRQNAHSSRSHCVITISLGEASFQLVDLAGAEKASVIVDDHRSKRACLRETNDINTSLLTLGSCLAALANQKPPPVRNSKLTLLQAEALCAGTGNISLICNVNPQPHLFTETLSTLKYADITGKIRRKMQDSSQSTYVGYRTPMKNRQHSSNTPANKEQCSAHLLSELTDQRQTLGDLSESLSTVEAERDRLREQLLELEQAEQQRLTNALTVCKQEEQRKQLQLHSMHTQHLCAVLMGINEKPSESKLSPIPQLATMNLNNNSAESVCVTLQSLRQGQPEHSSVEVVQSLLNLRSNSILTNQDDLRNVVQSYMQAQLGLHHQAMTELLVQAQLQEQKYKLLYSFEKREKDKTRERLESLASRNVLASLPGLRDVEAFASRWTQCSDKILDDDDNNQNQSSYDNVYLSELTRTRDPQISTPDITGRERVVQEYILHLHDLHVKSEDEKVRLTSDVTLLRKLLQTNGSVVRVLQPPEDPLLRAPHLRAPDSPRSQVKLGTKGLGFIPISCNNHKNNAFPDLKANDLAPNTTTHTLKSPEKRRASDDILSKQTSPRFKKYQSNSMTKEERLNAVTLLSHYNTNQENE